MAATIDFTLSVQVTGNFDNAQDNTTPTQPIDYVLQRRITTGTSTGQGTNFFEDTRSIATSTSEVLNLNGGLTNAFGQTISSQKIKTMWILASSTNTTPLTVGGATATCFPILGSSANTLTLRPGAHVVINDDSNTSFTSTNGNLMFLSSGAATAYRLFFTCTTA